MKILLAAVLIALLGSAMSFRASNALQSQTHAKAKATTSATTSTTTQTEMVANPSDHYWCQDSLLYGEYETMDMLARVTLCPCLSNNCWNQNWCEVTYFDCYECTTGIPWYEMPSNFDYLGMCGALANNRPAQLPKPAWWDETREYFGN